MAGQTDENRLHVLRHAAFTARDVREMERPLLENGVPLMRMASAATAHVVAEMLEDEGVALEESNIVLLLDPASEIPGCAAGFSAGEAGERLRAAVELAQHAHVIIDAMTGIGPSGALHGIAGTVASSLGVDGTIPDRTALPAGDSTGEFPLVVAVDVPSGDDGAITGPYIPADVTVTFGALKPCLMLPPAAYACGRVTLVDFSFDIDGHMPFVEAVSGDNAAETVRLPRLADTKYLRGVTGLITGSERYPGAAVLSCKAAAKTNIGMIRYMGPQVCRDIVLDAVPEAVLGKGRVQAWVVGSGVPTGETEDDDFQRETIAKLLTHYALSSDDDPDDDDDLAYDMPPLVVDAGALDLLPDEVPPQVVITPHAGELASLLTARGEDVDASDVQNEPLHWALRAHELTGATVLLKGAVTIVVGEPADTDRESDAQGGFADDEQHVRVVVSGRAPAWLGTAGAGDVLAGMLGALLAQQDDEDVSAPDVAACAAYLHGYAAAQASQSDQRGFTPPTIYGSDDRHLRTKLGHPIVASDVIGMIPATFAELLS